MEAWLVGSGFGEDRVLTVVLAGLCCLVGGLERGGWDESDLAMKASVVEPADVFGTAISTSATDFQPPLGRITGVRMHSALNSEFSASAMAVAFGTDRGDGLGFGEALGVANGSVVHAAVAVVD